MNSFRSLAPLLAVFLFAGGERAGAETYGGIEIGGKGVKATVVELRRGPAGLAVKVLLSASKNTGVTAGLAKTGRFDPVALKATAEAVASFAHRLQKEYKLPAKRVSIVGSSGLFSALKGNKKAIEKNRQALADSVRSASGMTMAFIDVAREARLSIDGIVPPGRTEVALLLDVGGGNTKGGCRLGRDRYVIFGVPFGSVTFADAADKQGKGDTFAEKLALARKKLLVPALRQAIADNPDLLKRQSIYLSGGASWALATLIKPGDRSSYVRLSAADVKAYHKLVHKANGKFPVVDLSSITDEKLRAAAAKEIRRVKKVFKPKQLQAGAEILLALSAEMHLDKAQRVTFVRHAQIGWLLAYLLEKAAVKQ